MMTSGIWDHKIIVLVLVSHILLVEMPFFFFWVSQMEESKSLIYLVITYATKWMAVEMESYLGFFIKNRLHKCLINLIIY